MRYVFVTKFLVHTILFNIRVALFLGGLLVGGGGVSYFKKSKMFLFLVKKQFFRSDGWWCLFPKKNSKKKFQKKISKKKKFKKKISKKNFKKLQNFKNFKIDLTPPPHTPPSLLYTYPHLFPNCSTKSMHFFPTEALKHRFPPGSGVGGMTRRL